MFENFEVVQLIDQGRALNSSLIKQLEIKIQTEITKNLDPLWRNYQADRLLLDQHLSFDVILDKKTKEIVGFSGLFNGGRYPKGVYRGLNRSYTFQKYRSKNLTLTGWHLDLLLPLQIKRYRSHLQAIFFSREGLHSKKLVQRLCKRLYKSTGIEWFPFDKLIQVAPGNQPTCFQWIGLAILDQTMSVNNILETLPQLEAFEYEKLFCST